MAVWLRIIVMASQALLLSNIARQLVFVIGALSERTVDNLKMLVAQQRLLAIGCILFACLHFKIVGLA